MPPKSSRDKALRKPKASSLKKSPKKTPVSRRRASAARSSASAATATTTTATSASGGTRTRKQPEPRRRTVPVISDSDDSDASDPTDDVEADSESSSSPASSSSSGHRGAGAMSSIEATVVPPSWIRISSDTVNYVELMLHRCRNAIEARGDYRTRDVNRVLAPLIQSLLTTTRTLHLPPHSLAFDLLPLINPKLEQALAANTPFKSNLEQQFEYHSRQLERERAEVTELRERLKAMAERHCRVDGMMSSLVLDAEGTLDGGPKEAAFGITDRSALDSPYGALECHDASSSEESSEQREAALELQVVRVAVVREFAALDAAGRQVAPLLARLSDVTVALYDSLELAQSSGSQSGSGADVDDE